MAAASSAHMIYSHDRTMGMGANTIAHANPTNTTGAIASALTNHATIMEDERGQAVNVIHSSNANVDAAAEEGMLPTFWCRALYDYQAADNSSLSFFRGDIIEVLTQLESGWWDGLMGDERGWFPSNYVVPLEDVVDDGGELYGNGVQGNGGVMNGEMHEHEHVGAGGGGVDGMQGMRETGMGMHGSEINQGWIQEERGRGGDYIPSRGNLQGATNGSMHTEVSSNQDFWLPEVDATGQIFYVNTLTGERSRDLPTELGAEGVNNDMDGIAANSQRSRGGAFPGPGDFLGGGGGGGATQYNNNNNTRAGFGFPKRSGTPEHWTKRLADDGLTYFYFNKITGQIQYTRPVPEDGATSVPPVPRITTAAEVVNPIDVNSNGRTYVAGPSSTTSGYASTNDMLFTEARLRVDSSASNKQGSSKRESVYSDDSEIQPRDNDVPERPPRMDNGMGVYGNRPRMTPAERAALMLQEALNPPEPESIDFLSDLTREAIIVVMASVDDSGLPRVPDHDKQVEDNVTSVVVAVRNLLYVSCALSGPLPNVYGEHDSGDPSATAVAQQLQAQLKASQRKVTATLSKLVLSARAARYKREAFSPEMMIRVEQDAADLQRAVDNFVNEVKKQYARPVIRQLHQRIGRKRLRGVFDIQHIGLGLPGAGVAGTWKGFGFINVDEGLGLPKRTLNDETLYEARTLQQQLDERLMGLVDLLQDMETTSDELLGHTQATLAYLSSYLSFIVDVNCQDIDIGEQLDPTPSNDPYVQAVREARQLLRVFEAVTQSLYDDGAILLTFAQNVPFKWPMTGSTADTIERQPIINSVYGSVRVLKAEAKMAVDYLDKLLAISREQIASESRFRESMALRISRMSIMDNSHRLSQFLGPMPDVGNEEEDVVDMDFVLRKGTARPAMSGIDNYPPEPENVVDLRAQRDEDGIPNWGMIEAQEDGHRKSLSVTKTVPEQDLVEDDEIEGKGQDKGPPKALKIRQLLGEDAPERYIEIANADQKPWYLRSDHNKDDIVLNPDGGIRAGTMTALIERLTTHEYGDPIFIRTFLMTYKSFTTLPELFDLLVKRYWIEPPEGLKQNELEEWAKLKQHVIRSRVLNTFKTMVTDDQVLVEDDMYILDRIKEFLLHPEVATSPASKNLLNIIERKKQGGLKPLTLTPPTTFPPPSIIPKGMAKGRLKLLDIDPLELARQLTIMEFALYRKIKAIECLQRSREQKAGEHKDHITDVIQMTNKIANWVNATVLGKEDSRKRAALVKQFIAVADRCRNLHNFSSMAAIISGLNSPPIRRLKRTWEQVNQRFMSQLGTCEMTLDSTKNFTNYKATLAQTNPPGIPFIGVYLTTLTFINDGSKDVLPGNLVNFGKRQRAAEIIREIQHWQSKDFNLAPLTPILTFIEESLSSFNDSIDWGEQFWNLSLEREPREREDEKMARLLQESGFL